MRRAELIPAAAVMAALAVLGAAARLVRPAAASAPVPGASSAVVSSAVRACPPAPDGSGMVALIAGAALAGHARGSTPGRPAPGRAALAPLPPAGLPLRPVSPVSLATPGALALITVPAAASTSKGASGQRGGSVAEGWSVSASGVMAPALEAEVAEPSGLATVRCGEPGSDLWFAGPGQADGAARIQLDLMNVDSVPATVNVSLITEAGPVQPGGATGITVPPHQTVTESLSSAAVGSAVLAIDVHTSAGRVAADVSEGSSGGAAWLPATAGPATRLVIPGVPPSSGTAGLFLVVPGSTDAKVSVLAVTAQGQYRPFGAQTVNLPGQSATYLALNALGGTAASLLIRASVPVTAAVLVPGSGPGAFTVAAAPISEQAVIAGNVSGSGLAASVLLTAPAAAARVRLTEIAPAEQAGPGGSASASQVVSVRAGRTLAAALSAPPGARHGSAFALLITPLAGSGPVYAARAQTRGSAVVSIVPASSALTTISLARASDSYAAISPGG